MRVVEDVVCPRGGDAGGSFDEGWVVGDAFVEELDTIGFSACLQGEELEGGAEGGKGVEGGGEDGDVGGFEGGVVCAVGGVGCGKSSYQLRLWDRG